MRKVENRRVKIKEGERKGRKKKKNLEIVEGRLRREVLVRFRLAREVEQFR